MEVIHILLSTILLGSCNGDLLPSDISIYRYGLHLNFTEDTLTKPPYEYKGFLEIMFSLFVNYPSDVKLYAAKDFIKIDSAFLTINSNETSNVTWWNIDDNDILTLGDTQIATTTAYASYLYINYTSRLSIEDMYGLYRTSYTKDGKTRYMIASQFEPTFARRVFPCLDEPTYKTNLRLNISHPFDVDIYFNTVEDTTLNSTNIDMGDTYNTTYLRTTGTMAPYMTGLIMTPTADLTCTVGENFTSTVYYYRICSRPGTEEWRNWALEIGPNIMDALINVTNYGFGVIMGFPKMELVTLPASAMDALENWGLITYREENILYDEENSSSLDKQTITETLTFEFAQMFFGNLASPQWWHYLYLSKGVSYYLQFLITDKIFEDWDLYNQFVYRVLQPALHLDSFRFSPNLRYEVNTTDEILSRFDKFTLLKGASLQRMLNEAIAGYKNYRQGLEYYLTSFSYRNSEPQGLWNLIGAQINLDNRALLPPDTYLKDVLIGWEVNPGYPLLDITRYETNITISQVGRFLYTGLDPDFEWCVPVSYVRSSNLTDFENATVNEYVMPNSSFAVLDTQDESWIILNTLATGYYRVNYNNMWQNISDALQNADFSGIPELNRAQLLDDVFALARANILDYSFLFDFVAFLSEEESFYVWMTALNGIKYMLRRVEYTSTLGLKIEERFFNSLSKVYASVPWSNISEEDQAYSIKQIELLKEFCYLGYLDCVKNALSQFSNFKSSGNRPHKNLREIVYCTGVRYGDTSNWDAIWTSYSSTDFESEKLKILSSLGCTENEDLIKKTLALTLDESGNIKAQHSSIVFKSVYSSSKIGADLALEFLIENHEVISKRYQGTNVLRNVLTGLAEHLVANEQISQFRKFLQNTDSLAVEFKNAANQALEITDVNVIWLDNHLDELNKYFGLSANKIKIKI